MEKVSEKSKQAEHFQRGKAATRNVLITRQNDQPPNRYEPADSVRGQCSSCHKIGPRHSPAAPRCPGKQGTAQEDQSHQPDSGFIR